MPAAPNIVLEVWEHAQRLAPAMRPVALLSLEQSNADVKALAELPLGVRDAALLRIQQDLFGDKLECVTNCPACSSVLEFTASAGEFLLQAGKPGIGEYWLERHGYRIRFRPPNSADLAVSLDEAAAADAFRAHILRRCVLAIHGPEENADIDGLPVDLTDTLVEEMERRDPLGTIWLELECVHCRHAWRSLFDIATLLWSNLDRWATMVLHEVHLLARAYGWTERDVLQLSAARRARYLGMIGA
jgi:hypothetical protein